MNSHLFSADRLPSDFTVALEQAVIQIKEHDTPVMPLAAVSAKRRLDDLDVIRLILTFSVSDIYVNLEVDYRIRSDAVLAITVSQQNLLQNNEIYWGYVVKTLLPRIRKWMQYEGKEILRKADIQTTAIYQKVLSCAIAAAKSRLSEISSPDRPAHQHDARRVVSSGDYIVSIEEIDINTQKTYMRLAFATTEAADNPDLYFRTEVAILVNADDIRNWPKILKFVEYQIFALIDHGTKQIL